MQGTGSAGTEGCTQHVERHNLFPFPSIDIEQLILPITNTTGKPTETSMDAMSRALKLCARQVERFTVSITRAIHQGSARTWIDAQVHVMVRWQ